MKYNCNKNIVKRRGGDSVENNENNENNEKNMERYRFCCGLGEHSDSSIFDFLCFYQRQCHPVGVSERKQRVYI